MSHNWLHTPDCKVLNEKGRKGQLRGGILQQPG